MDDHSIIDEDFNKAGSFLNNLFFGMGRKDTVDRLKAMFTSDKYTHPLVTLFSNHRQEYSSVPVEPTDAMCDGLAKEIMVWSHLDGPKTVKRLFAHLTVMDIPIPDWLRNEEALQDLASIPSERVHCQLIYKAMTCTYLDHYRSNYG